MRIKVIFIILLGCILSCSCNDSKKKHNDSTQVPGSTGKVARKATFFDSIMAKQDIPVLQLQRHLADTGYFTHNSHFSGDTVYYPDSNYPIVILSMDFDGVCLEKYLLVYKKNSPKNTGCMRVETDCDIDYGTNYSKLYYKVFNQTQFFTRDVWYEVDSASKVKITRNDHFYRINEKGKIDSLKKKPDGLILPKFIPMDVTDSD